VSVSQSLVAECCANKLLEMQQIMATKTIGFIIKNFTKDTNEIKDL
jgi:hypothetical protein